MKPLIFYFYSFPDIRKTPTHAEPKQNQLGNFDIDMIELETLLFQTGYLTIKKIIQRLSGNMLILDYPNIEVKQSFNDSILNYLSPSSSEKEQNKYHLEKALLAQDITAIQKIFQLHFASIPHDWFRKNKLAEYEGYYSSVFYAYFSALGLDVIAEDTTNKGRIDLVIPMEAAVFIFEFKVVTPPGNVIPPLKQIKQNKYHEKYQDGNRTIYLIGIEFSKIERNITDYQWEMIK